MERSLASTVDVRVSPADCARWSFGPPSHCGSMQRTRCVMHSVYIQSWPYRYELFLARLPRSSWLSAAKHSVRLVELTGWRHRLLVGMVFRGVLHCEAPRCRVESLGSIETLMRGSMRPHRTHFGDAPRFRYPHTLLEGEIRWRRAVFGSHPLSLFGCRPLRPPAKSSALIGRSRGHGVRMWRTVNSSPKTWYAFHQTRGS
jgi:hypothetical protein